MTDTRTPVEPTTPVPTESGVKPRWLWRIVKVLALLVLILGVRAWQQSGTASGQAPALTGVMLGGKPVALKAFAGQPVLVHFWATWCPICRAEQDSIDALARDVPVITVAMQSGGHETVARYLQQEALHFPVLNDPDGMIASQWGVRAVPASFIVDGAGQIRFVEVGYTTGIGLRLRLWLAGLR